MCIRDRVYGDLPLDRPDLFFHEDTPIHTSSPYSSSKAAADVYKRQAFTILTSLGAFEEVGLKSLRKICFSGSVMPCRVCLLYTS